MAGGACKRDGKCVHVPQSAAFLLFIWTLNLVKLKCHLLGERIMYTNPGEFSNTDRSWGGSVCRAACTPDACDLGLTVGQGYTHVACGVLGKVILTLDR